MSFPHFKPVAAHALLVELADKIDDEINRQIIELDQLILKAGFEGICETVPAFVNMLVLFDPIKTDHKIIEQKIRTLWPFDLPDLSEGRLHEIDVCYEAEFSPDLKRVARLTGLSGEAVINAHLGAEYRVNMYGFAPGYAYLSGVPQSIQVPRKDKAVRDMPAGSVMIAGPQCLATTLKMPTGWSIIGRTKAKIMTGDIERPFLFDVGDRVRFKRISRDEFGKAP